MSPRFECVVFDFDGVLVDSVDIKTRAFAELYTPYGSEVVEEVVAYHLQHGGVARHKKFRHFHCALLGRNLTEEAEAELTSRFSALVEDAVVAAPWIRGAHEFLEANSGRLPLYVASGTPQEELLRIMDRRAASQYFRAVFGSPETKSEILNRIKMAGSHDPRRLLMVGDSIEDLEGALSVGVMFLGRVAPGSWNPFPPSVPTLIDMSGLEHIVFG